MADPALTDDVPSPCIQVCLLDAAQVCTGCGRTLDEIARWRGMTAEEKRAVWARLGRKPGRRRFALWPRATRPGRPAR